MEQNNQQVPKKKGSIIPSVIGGIFFCFGLVWLFLILIAVYLDDDGKPEQWFPYDDCEYLQVERLSDAKSDKTLAEEFRASLYALNNGEEPLNQNIIFSENNKMWIAGYTRGDPDFNVAYCFCVASENKAIIDFQITFEEGELTYLKAKEKWMKKAYLERQNGSWILRNIFTGGG